jgi:hypothetical protein
MPAAVDVSAGSDHTLALSVTGGVYGWGKNWKGQLGRDPSVMPTTPVPQPIPGLSEGVRKVAAGGDFSLALTVSGTVYAWGANDYGQAGNGTVMSYVYEPAAVLNNVIDIAAGVYHALALTSSGALYEWGKGLTGSSPITAPTLVTTTAAGFTDIREISCGYDHCTVLTAANKLFAWGTNDQGHVGPTATALHPNPVAVNHSLSSPIVHAAAGYRWTSVTTEDHKFYSWGFGAYGQLGNGTYNSSGNPVAADFSYAGPLQSLALKGVSFHEVFSPDLYAYTASVPNSVTDIEVLAEAVYPTHGIQVYIGPDRRSYVPRPYRVHLAAGASTSIEVVAWDPIIGESSYYITVTREGPPAGAAAQKPLYAYEVNVGTDAKMALVRFDQVLDSVYLYELSDYETMRNKFLFNGNLPADGVVVSSDRTSVIVYLDAWNYETSEPIALPDITSITLKDQAVVTLQGLGNISASVPVISADAVHAMLTAADPSHDGVTVDELVAYMKLNPDANGNGVPNEPGDAAMLLDFIEPKFITYNEEPETSV